MKRKLNYLATFLSLVSGCSAIHLKHVGTQQLYVSSIVPLAALVDTGSLYLREIPNGLEAEKIHFTGLPVGRLELPIPEGAQEVEWSAKRDFFGIKVRADFYLNGKRESLKYRITENATRARREN